MNMKKNFLLLKIYLIIFGILVLMNKSIKANINKEEIYFTYTHALLSICSKLSKRAILHSDSLVSSIKQITLLIDVFIDYIKGGK